MFCFVFSHLLSMIPFKLSNLPLLLWLFLFCGRLLLSLLPSSFCFFLSTLQSHSSYLSSSSLPFSFFLLYLHCCFSFFFTLSYLNFLRLFFLLYLQLSPLFSYRTVPYLLSTHSTIRPDIPERSIGCYV